MSELVWPSDQKLQRLRQEGVVPISLVALRMIVSLGIVLWIVLGGDHVLTLWEHALKAESPDMFWQGSENHILHVFLVPLIVASLGAILLGLLQSRFLFAPGLLSIRMQGLWHCRLIPKEGDFMRLLLYLLGPLCCITLAASTLFLVLFPLLSMLRLDSERIPVVVWESAQRLLPIVFGVQILGIVASILLYRLLFLWHHRMSMDEVRKEAEEE